MIKKYKDIQKGLDYLREHGNPRGENTGFKAFDELYSMKQGSFTMILAAPHHGKSELCFEILFNQASKYGKKALIYSPETGSVEDIYAEFIHKYLGKTVYQSIPGHATDKEYYQAIDYVDAMFSVVDSDEKSYSFEDLTKMVKEEEIILSDPYNELKHDMSQYNGRQDIYIEELMGEIRRYCKKNKKHCLQTLHPSHQQMVVEKGFRYYPMPLAREAAGGQANLRKAMTWINMWRPPTGFVNEETGLIYDDNEVLINIEKAKPKGVAKKGTCSLFFDWKRNRYYEKRDGKPFYAFEHEKGTHIVKPTELSPSTIFESDLAPF